MNVVEDIPESLEIELLLLHWIGYRCVAKPYVESIL